MTRAGEKLYYDDGIGTPGTAELVLFGSLATLSAVMSAISMWNVAVAAVGLRGVLIAAIAVVIPLIAMALRERPTLRLSRPAAIARRLRRSIGGLECEEVRVLYFDRKGDLISEECLVIGNRDSVVLDIKRLLSNAVRMGSPYLILAHNHPSQDPMPSLADLRVTDVLIDDALRRRVRIFDHIVVTRRASYSMRKAGLICLA